MIERNPFCDPNGSQTFVADDRLRRVKDFTLAQCKAALDQGIVPDLQATVRRALEKRIDRLVEHHHNKVKGRKK